MRVVRKPTAGELEALYGAKPGKRTMMVGVLAAGVVVALGVVALLLLRR